MSRITVVRISRRIVSYAIQAALLFGFACVHVVSHSLRWRERPDPATGVAVDLRPAHQVIKLGGEPNLSVMFIHRGKKDVILVQPGDGSGHGGAHR